MTAVIHIAGNLITVGTFQRQRCLWCGATLIDRDLKLVMVPTDQPQMPPSWPPGDLVGVDGGLSYVVAHEDGQPLPDGACARLDPAVTR